MEKTPPPMAKDDTTEDSSEDPKYRPPLTMGEGNNSSSSSSDEDSELSRPYSLSSECQCVIDDDDTGSDGNDNWGWWADHGDKMTTVVKRTPTTTPPIENKFIASEICPIKFPSDNYELCIGCKNMYTTSIYCTSCWKIKKYCLPPMRLKLSRSKIKAARQKRTEQRDNNRIRSDDTLSGSNENETEDPISAQIITASLCMFCCTNPRNASLIHGQIGHQLCCYPCAKKLWKEQARCPICRRKVEKIVKLIQHWFLKNISTNISIINRINNVLNNNNNNNNNNNKWKMLNRISIFFPLMISKYHRQTDQYHLLFSKGHHFFYKINYYKFCIVIFNKSFKSKLICNTLFTYKAIVP